MRSFLLSATFGGSLLIGTVVAAPDATTQESGAQDLDRAIKAARAVVDPPVPASAQLDAVAGRISGQSIPFAAVLEETVLLYALPLTDMLAREAVLRAETKRRGVEVRPPAVRAAIQQFVARQKPPRPLDEILRARNTSWIRFETRMRHNAIRSALLAKDRIDPADEAATGAWTRRLLSLYPTVTDPLAVPAGVFAIVRNSAGAEIARITTRDLLAERLPSLTLRHLDTALSERARALAIDATLKARGVEPSAGRVAARVKKLRSEYRADFPWERALTTVGRNAHAEIRRFRHDDAIDQIIGADVDEPTLRAYYDARPDHFGRATVTASHILIRSADARTGRVDFTAAKRKIDQVSRELREGAEFVDLVKRYSEDNASRQRGGDIGMFTLVSAYDREFCRLAFNLREGEVSPPVKTRQGWHLIHCRQRTKPNLETNSFERIRDVVHADRQADLRRRWISRYVEISVDNFLDEIAAPFLR